MVRKDRCCVGICNTDRRYADKLEIKSHVQILKWHRFPKDKAKRKWWQTVANKGREKPCFFLEISQPNLNLICFYTFLRIKFL